MSKQTQAASSRKLVEAVSNEAAYNFEYDVFISYSHQDKAFARRLYRALSNYRPPSDLPLPQRRLRAFRDERDFLGTNYTEAVTLALKSSAKLVLLCTPSSRKSSYVGQEIMLFSKLRGGSHVVPVLVAGLPNNDTSDPEQAAFHSALIEETPVPLASDFR